MTTDVLSPISVRIFPLLFLVGVVAGLVDSIAGGGGLITLPVLLGLGIPPQYALGTNKLQSTFGSASAMAHFVQAGTVSLREGLAGILWTALGAGLGAYTVQLVDPGLLRRLIPLLLLVIVVYTLLTPRLGAEDVHPRLGQGLFYLVFGLGLGFYDGFLGPGTGSFWVIALMLGLGFNMTRATGYTKVMNFTSNIVALGIFVAGGCVYYGAGLAMGLGQAMGARIGSRLVISRGTRFVRPIFIAAVLAVTVRLLYQNFR